MEAIDQKFVHPDRAAALFDAKGELQHRYRAVFDGLQLCRPHTVHVGPRKAKTFLIRSAAPTFQLARRHPTPRG